jgi:acyl-CoA thioester hydrolase
MAHTWVGEPSGATWERFTEIVRKGEERPLVAARTVWVLLDAATGRPRRIDPDLIASFSAPRQK